MEWEASLSTNEVLTLDTKNKDFLGPLFDLKISLPERILLKAEEDRRRNKPLAEMLKEIFFKKEEDPFNV